MDQKIKDAIVKVYDKAIKDPDKNAGERIKVGNKIIKINVNAEDERTIWIRVKNRGIR